MKKNTFILGILSLFLFIFLLTFATAHHYHYDNHNHFSTKRIYPVYQKSNYHVLKRPNVYVFESRPVVYKRINYEYYEYRPRPFYMYEQSSTLADSLIKRNDRVRHYYR